MLIIVVIKADLVEGVENIAKKCGKYIGRQFKAFFKYLHAILIGYRTCGTQ